MSNLPPRRTVEPSYGAQLNKKLREMADAIAALERGASLRNASISGGEGLKVYGPDDKLRISLNTEDGAVVAYNAEEQPVARYGPLDNSAPGDYGVEVLVDGVWLQLGRQSTTWGQVGGKPSWAASSASIAASYISGQVASAATAASAAQADGSQYGWTNTVAGTEFYQLWVGNDGGFHFGRNTSSLRYKMNVRDAGLTADAVMKLRPVRYDRKPTYETLPAGVEGPLREYPGVKDELGLIAEEVDTVLPEIVTRHDGQIDGVRYELLAVAMLPLLQEHVRIAGEQAEQLEAQAKQIAALTEAVKALGGEIA